MRKRVGTFDATTADDAAKELQSAWQQHISPIQSAQWSHESARWIQLSTDGLVGTVPRDAAQPYQGVLSGEPNTVHTSLVVTKLVSGRTRSQKNGRVYLPAALESDVDMLGTVLLAAQGSTDQAFGLIFAAFNTSSDYQLGVGAWSKTNKPPEPQEGQIVYWPGQFNPLSGFKTQPTCGTQRRRIRR